MFCNNCGANIPDGSSFCPNCGTRFGQPNMGYQQPNMGYQQPNMGYQQKPAMQLKTNRGLLKFILLSMITFGIYGIVVMCTASSDINVIATRHDGKKTMNYFLAMLLGVVTFGIVPLVWTHRFCNRIGNELKLRNVPYEFSASTFWLWGVLGCFILVGPFIYMHKLLKSMNLICENYNMYG